MLAIEGVESACVEGGLGWRIFRRWVYRVGRKRRERNEVEIREVREKERGKERKRRTKKEKKICLKFQNCPCPLSHVCHMGRKDIQEITLLQFLLFKSLNNKLGI